MSFDVQFPIKDVLSRPSEEVQYYLLSRRRGIAYVQYTREGYLDWAHLAWELPSETVTEGKAEGRIEVSGRRGRRRKQLLGETEERKGYWRLNDGALDRIGELALEGAVELSQEEPQI